MVSRGREFSAGCRRLKEWRHRGILSAAFVKTFKTTIRALSKILGGIAGLVFLRAPFTNNGVALMVGSVVVGMVCIGAYTWSEPNDDDPPLETKDSN